MYSEHFTNFNLFLNLLVGIGRYFQKLCIIFYLEFDKCNTQWKIISNNQCMTAAV